MPPATKSHNPAAESTPPGNRHAIPTTATGSSTLPATRVAGTAGAAVSLSKALRYRASAAGVGWSKTSVAGNVSPVCRVKALRSSRAVSESMPRSLNARSVSRAAGSGWANTVAVAVATSVVRVCSCCGAVWPASRAPSPWALAVCAWGRVGVSADRMGGKVCWRAWRANARAGRG